MAPRKKKSKADAAPPMSIDPKRYDAVKLRGADGRLRLSRGNGDAVATAMLGLDHDALVKVMRANGLADKLGAYANPAVAGRFRMLLGNSLRALVRKGTPVDVAGTEVRTLKQRVGLPEGASRVAA